MKWWARLDGGDEAIERAAAYNNTPALRTLWNVNNFTRLQDNPELFSAVASAQVPYGLARRLDAAYQAESALKSKQILADAGIPESQVDPRTVTPAQAAVAARQRKQQQEAAAEQGGNWFTDLLGGIWDAGKATLDAIGTAFGVIESPIAAPMRAGAAEQTGLNFDLPGVTREDAERLPFYARNLLIGSNPIKDWVSGAANIIGGVDGQQAEDMRRAGYDPDSWTDRYAWYADISGDNGLVSDRRVSELKQEYNPHKVDLVREIITSGAVDDPQSVGGLSEDAQRLYVEITGNRDAEGAKIFERLYADTWGTPGAYLAEGIGLEDDSGLFTAVQAVGDLAFYWYADPLAAGGAGLRLWRRNKWAVDVDPTAVKDAIINRPNLARRYDDILDRIDKIHVLSESGRVEDRVAAAREMTRFQQKYADMMPHFDTLLGLRRGSIRGAFFKAPARKDRLRDIADIRQNMIDIRRVDDPAEYQPAFALRSKPSDEVSDEVREAARAAVADRIGDALVAEAVLSGRPLLKNKMLMPGQVRLSYPLRAATRVFSERAFSRSGLLFRQLKEAEGKGVIDWAKADTADAAVSGVIDSAEGGKWIRDNYTRGGLRTKAAYALSRFALARDAATLKLDGPDSVKTFHDFTRFLLPRGQAAFLSNEWAKADPAKRSVMLSNVMEMMANARHARDTKQGKDFWDQALKGRQQVRRPTEPIKEAYSTPRTDMLDTPSGPITAAMYSTQFADGVKLPSFLEIARNTERVGVLSWIVGLGNTELVSRATRFFKIGQVGTTSNMLRQATEARAMQFLEHPSGAVRAALARVGLVGGNAALRAETNAAVRDAKKALDAGVNKQLQPLYAQGRYGEAAERVREALGGKVAPALIEMVSDGAHLDDIAKSRSTLRLAATRFGGIDWLRRRRAKLYSNLTKEAGSDHAEAWFHKVDTEYAERLQDAAFRVIGGQRSHYMDGAMVDDLEQIDNGLRAGHRLSLLRLANTQGHLGVAGDTGALRWLNALGMRLADPVGVEVFRAVARQALESTDRAKHVHIAQSRARRAFERANPGRTISGDSLARVAEAAERAFPASEDAFEVARRLLVESPHGKVYRLNGRRAQYFDGNYISPEGDRTLALNKWAEDMVADARHYLGVDAARAMMDSGALPREHEALLRKLADGGDLEPDDLARIPDDFRPDSVHAPIVVGKQFVEGGNLAEKLVDGATKFYQLVVVRPLQRMVNDPQTVAAHREVMDSMEPLARALKERGMSDQAVYDLLQTGAYGHAINRVTRYSDNPNVTSYFAALSNNFLWYERAMEDFVRRAMTVTKADPAVLARAYVLTEAGVHSGLISKEVQTDDEGNRTEEWVFTWPGSGLFMRTINESLQALGIADSVKIPVWQDFTSPVRYLSPSLQNPIGFTTTPLIGLPMRAVRDMFPQTAPTIDTLLTSLEGGERFFGSQSALESLLPVHFKRVWSVLDPNDRDSQFASSFRNALAYFDAAGLLPGPDASAAERQRALDDVATMVQNNLVFRAVFATFAPATPGMFGSNVSGIGDDEVNVIDAARGVTTIRGEWFQLLEEYTQRYADSSQAYSEAMIEWLSRGHGSILNPEAFTVGSTDQPNSPEGAAFGSGQELTQWMLSHREFMTRYGEVAYSLLPEFSGPWYDQIGYRLQLRNGLRQHKTGGEFYDDLSAAQAWRDYNKAARARDEALRRGMNPDTLKNWFSEYTRQLEMRNPIWAAKRGESSTPEYVAHNIAPALRDLVSDEDVPGVVRPLLGDLRLLVELYDEYQYARARATSRQERINLAVRYGERGDELFANGPLDDLWSRMRVWED